MNKRIISLLMALVMTISSLALVACDGGGGNGGTGDVFAKFDGDLASESGAVLQILENDTAKKLGYLDELLAAFNEEYKEYNITAVDANVDEYSDLAKNGPFGFGPDVLFQANDVIMKYVSGKHVLPLPHTTMDCTNAVSSQALDAYKGKVGDQEYVFGAPVNVQSPVLFYRKDLLPTNWETEWDDDKNGVPDMLEYWTEMFAYSQQIIEDSDGTKYGYMKSLSDPYFSLGYLLSYGAYVFGDNDTDVSDIGLDKGNAHIGAKMIMQLSTIMDERTLDDSITLNSYSMIGNGTYFATMTTPDVASLFVKELQNYYIGQGKSSSEAYDLAIENIATTSVPQLPVSGDLTDRDGEMMDMTCMGGVNGYAISSYTKYPNASLAFVEFASSYEMASQRSEKLGLVPARLDLAEGSDGVTKMISDNLEEGAIYLMPSVSEVGRLWTPIDSFFADICNDTWRKDSEKKYTTTEEIQAGLAKLSKDIYDAIHLLS